VDNYTRLLVLMLVWQWHAVNAPRLVLLITRDCRTQDICDEHTDDKRTFLARRRVIPDRRPELAADDYPGQLALPESASGDHSDGNV
jgi:hypothetical protein